MDWLIALAVVVVGLPALAWLGQERLIFFPQPVESTRHLPATASPVTVTGADGARLRGWALPGAKVPAPALIYFGGNAEEVSWTVADAHWPADWTRIAINYRGYGESEGAPGETALVADAALLYDAVAQRADVDPTRIVVVGRSLGAGVAVALAAARPVAGVVLVSPFDSLVALGRTHYPYLPVSLLLRHRFDSAAHAASIGAPLLAIVGADDTIVPVARSRALFDAWRGPKHWVAIPNADHNDLGIGDAYWNAINDFLAARRGAP